jgi:hypothetical protein
MKLKFLVFILIILKIHRCPCLNHALNLSVLISSNVSSIRNSIGVIKDNLSFLTSSSKRKVIVDSIYQNKTGGTKQDGCIESLSDFCSSFETIIDVLDEISEWKDPTASNKAKALTNSLTNFEFLTSLHCQVSILHLFLPLSKIFHKQTIDVVHAQNLIDNLIATLKNIRANKMLKQYVNQ